MADLNEDETAAGAEIIDVITDALGNEVRVGWSGSAVIIGVTRSPAIFDTPQRRDQFAKAYAESERRAEAYAAATRECNTCPGPASCSEYGRCVLEAETCDGCWHLLSLHGPNGCTAKVYPAHSLTGEPCPCEQVPKEREGDAGFPVVPRDEIEAKVAADMYRLTGKG